jgi:hypothetical protein
MLLPAQRRAAEVVLRSCDMILARLDRMSEPVAPARFADPAGPYA